MLNVTGQRGKSHPTKSVAFSPSIFTGNELENPKHTINRREISGKKRGALVLVEAAGNKFIPYVALGDQPEDSWVPYFVEQGGGGGGGNPLAITEIDPSSMASHIRIKRANGTEEDVDFLPTIQNTPSYVLGFNMKTRQHQMTSSTALDAGGLPVRGYGSTVKGNKINRVYAPASLFELGGLQKGGQYDPTDNSFYVAANNVEVSFQLSWSWGFHPTWSKFSKGRPIGRATTGTWIEWFNPVTKEWEDLYYFQHYHGNQTSHPNTSPPTWGINGSAVKLPRPKAGKYRVGFIVEECSNSGLSSDDFRYIRLFATSANLVDGYWQVTGSIKDVSESEVIPPVPKP